MGSAVKRDGGAPCKTVEDWFARRANSTRASGRFVSVEFYHLTTGGMVPCHPVVTNTVEFEYEYEYRNAEYEYE